VDSALVGPALVLDHGGLSAEAIVAVSARRYENLVAMGASQGVPLQTAVVGAFVRALAGVDATMPGQTRRLCWSQ